MSNQFNLRIMETRDTSMTEEEIETLFKDIIKKHREYYGQYIYGETVDDVVNGYIKKLENHVYYLKLKETIRQNEIKTITCN